METVVRFRSAREQQRNEVSKKEDERRKKESRKDKQMFEPMWSAVSLDPVLFQRTTTKWPTLSKKIPWRATPNYQMTRFDCVPFLY